MMRRWLILFLLMAGAAGVGAWMMVGGTSGTSATPEPPQSVDLAEGAELYQEYCASCHGADLEGQAGWRSAGEDGILPAPPHDETGHTWHHPDSILFDYTKLGGKKTLAKQGVDFQSGMPGFGNELTDAQIWNILAFIKSSWSARARQVQAVRTEAEQMRGN